MEPVSHYRDGADLRVKSGSGGIAAADMNAHMGALQIGGAGEMLIDEYDPVDEKPDVAIINPDDPLDEPEPELLADDCRLRPLHICNAAEFLSVEAMKSRFLPELPNLEADSEATSTWHIEDWRRQKQKERSPTFECGGHPWFVNDLSMNADLPAPWQKRE